METIEIRQNKSKVIPMLFLLIAALLGMTYYFWFSEKSFSNTIKLLYAFSTVCLLYTLYISTKNIVKNEPVLTFRKSEIEINEKGTAVMLLWQQIIDWRIDRDKENGTYFLVIETADTRREINISWLDKKPDEIQELLQDYKNN